MGLYAPVVVHWPSVHAPLKLQMRVGPDFHWCTLSETPHAPPHIPPRLKFTDYNSPERFSPGPTEGPPMRHLARHSFHTSSTLASTPPKDRRREEPGRTLHSRTRYTPCLGWICSALEAEVRTLHRCEKLIHSADCTTYHHRYSCQR